ncbi:hypothetical protein [Saccharothrix algeriensis]|uniref:Uncharacterized protein n=1 Tax=Saccharothrix algeriensis TaxID=173560 RepID=A0A8T8HZZ1_9PSEU|nr:hypothetical protein [Saccharothrix algeriensis]MBM7815052.1 hypothetical protein [Saccharothrix algeriensis]QTR03304.1 hypothetical protein J7S33_30990 [Saccharothrix algeriensis]
MLSPKAELIWQGRLHLGDEPGVFGDAAYSGLAAELPVTLEKLDPAGPDTTTLVVETLNVETFGGYNGHLITVTLYEPSDEPDRFTETVLETERLTGADGNRKEIALDLAGRRSPAFVSVRVRVDTGVPPGLYDDFLLVRLSNRSAEHSFVASLGFHA